LVDEIEITKEKNFFNKFQEFINKNFKTLPFTNRYLNNDNLTNPNYESPLKILANNNYIHSYPPLCVGKNDWTAQYEHTVYIGKNNKIVFSRGEDY
jgi:methionyl aminopeptidase